jgi:hypothetical protein
MEVWDREDSIGEGPRKVDVIAITNKNYSPDFEIGVICFHDKDP